MQQIKPFMWIVMLLFFVSTASCQTRRPPAKADPPPQESSNARGPVSATTQGDPADQAYQGSGAVTTGRAQATRSCAVTTSCSRRTRFVEGRCGQVTDASGKNWPVPSPIEEGRACPALYDKCNGSGENPNYSQELETIVVDEDGEEVTAYLHGDNYVELYVNGQYICRDPIAFVPFNSNVVRVKAKYPITYAVRLVDWGEHVGLGMEYGRYNIGDGGFAARFSDGTETNASWKCEVFYIAPLDNPSCVTENALGQRNSTQCSSRPDCQSNPDSCQALHFEVPTNWMAPNFDDSQWAAATEWTEERVRPKPAFSDFPELFQNAKFIWSPNLDLDNQVLCRITVQGPQQG